MLGADAHWETAGEASESQEFSASWTINSDRYRVLIYQIEIFKAR